MIRKAVSTDLESVVKIYDEIFDLEEAGQSFTNWQRGLYPTGREAEKACADGTLYVMENAGAIVGSANLNRIQPAAYGEIPWQFSASAEEVLVIHTLCISPGCAGQGFARRFVEFYESLARQTGCKALRLDTYEGNIPANALYTKLGYNLAGKTLFHFENVIWETLNCYEKRV